MIRSTIFIFLPVRYDSCNEYYRIKKFPWKSLMHEAIPFLNKFITRYIHGRPLLCCMDLHAMKACNDQSKALVVSQVHHLLVQIHPEWYSGYNPTVDSFISLACSYLAFSSGVEALQPQGNWALCKILS